MLPLLDVALADAGLDGGLVLHEGLSGNFLHRNDLNVIN